MTSAPLPRITRVGKLLIATTAQYTYSFTPQPRGRVEMIVYDIGGATPLATLVLPADMSLITDRGWDMVKIQELIS